MRRWSNNSGRWLVSGPCNRAIGCRRSASSPRACGSTAIPRPRPTRSSSYKECWTPEPGKEHSSQQPHRSGRRTTSWGAWRPTSTSCSSKRVSTRFRSAKCWRPSNAESGTLANRGGPSAGYGTEGRQHCAERSSPSVALFKLSHSSSELSAPEPGEGRGRAVQASSNTPSCC